MNSQLFLKSCSYQFYGKKLKGKLDGPGQLRIDPNMTQQTLCIQLHSSLIQDNQTPNAIEGVFENGVVHGYVNITWKVLGYKLETFTPDGVLDGIFKAEKLNSSAKMIGFANRNEMFENYAWLIHNDTVSVVFFEKLQAQASFKGSFSRLSMLNLTVCSI